PRFEKAWYHHVTLRYGVERYEVQAIIGQKHQIEAYAAAFNDQAQAVRVETNGLPDEYGVPHVTISTAAAVKPFASVAMLKGSHDTAAFSQLLNKTRHFCLNRCRQDASTQDRLSSLAACEDPAPVAAHKYAGQKRPRPQTGQTSLAYELLPKPHLPGVFCVST